MLRYMIIKTFWKFKNLQESNQRKLEDVLDD